MYPHFHGMAPDIVIFTAISRTATLRSCHADWAMARRPDRSSASNRNRADRTAANRLIDTGEEGFLDAPWDHLGYSVGRHAKHLRNEVCALSVSLANRCVDLNLHRSSLAIRPARPNFGSSPTRWCRISAASPRSRCSPLDTGESHLQPSSEVTRLDSQ
jgi:hypothetical protein